MKKNYGYLVIHFHHFCSTKFYSICFCIMENDVTLISRLLLDRREQRYTHVIKNPRDFEAHVLD